MRYIAIVKSVASKEPRFLVSASVLKRTCQSACQVIWDAAYHICESLSTGSLDFTKTSRALSPTKRSQQDATLQTVVLLTTEKAVRWVAAQEELEELGLVLRCDWGETGHSGGWRPRGRNSKA